MRQQTQAHTISKLKPTKMTIHASKYANFFSRDAFDVIREGVWVAQTDVNRPHTEIRISLLKDRAFASHKITNDFLFSINQLSLEN